MKVIKVHVTDGTIIPDEPLETTGRSEGVLVLSDPDPWQDILNDARPRPKLDQAHREAIAEYDAGLTKELKNVVHESLSH